MRSTLTTWFLLFGLLLQSAAWALPGQRLMQAQHLAHALAHAIDHGHHAHASGEQDARGHDVDAALQWNEAPDHSGHGPHHTHAGEAGQVQGLPVPVALAALHLPGGPPHAWALWQPASADPSGLLRPPQRTATR